MVGKDGTPICMTYSSEKLSQEREVHFGVHVKRIDILTNVQELTIGNYLLWL